ncbi:MAG: glycosyltransferase [Geminicoccaceae bacterium]
MALSIREPTRNVVQVVPDLDDVEARSAVLQAAGQLARSGHRSVVVTREAARRRDLVAGGLSLMEFPKQRGWLGGDRETAAALANVLRLRGADLVHLHGMAQHAMVAQAAKRAGVPLLISTHGEPAPGTTRPTATVIASSGWLAQRLCERWGLGTSEVKIVPVGIDLDQFDPERVRGHRVAKVSDGWGLPIGPKVVLLPGPIAAGRGHVELLEALGRLPRRDFTILFAGGEVDDDSCLRSILRVARATGLADLIRFGGSVADRPAMFMVADLVVLPRDTPDPTGRLSLEAQAMGRPVIVADAGALAETVMPAATGWLVPPGEVGELSWALDLALGLSDEVRFRLAARAREFVAGEFGAAIAGSRLLALYARLMGDHSAPEDPRLLAAE